MGEVPSTGVDEGARFDPDEAEVFHESNTWSALEMSFGEGQGGYGDLGLTWFNLCLRGSGRLVLSSGIQELDARYGPGSIAITPAGPDGQASWESAALFSVGIRHDAVDDIARSVTGGRDFAVAELTARFQRSPMLAAALRALRMEAYRGGLSASLVESYLGAGIAEVARQALTSRPTIRAVQPLARSKLRRVTALIQEGLGADLSIGDLADAADLSRFHFSRAFQAAIGQAPHAYIQSLRMESARRSLAKPELSITDIAASVGFQSTSAFSAAFKRHHGIAPSDYRVALGS